jgi:hypothetical protein
MDQLSPHLLNDVVSWAQQTGLAALSFGLPLTPRGRSLARSVGVLHPECIRVCPVDQLPIPRVAELRRSVHECGLNDSYAIAIGYCVFILNQWAENPLLLSQQFRFVHQYEKAGTVERFLRAYLAELAEFGVSNAPMDADAQAHQFDDSRLTLPETRTTH